MGTLDIILIIVIALIFILAVFFTIRRRKKGCCCGCSGEGSCPACRQAGHTGPSGDPAKRS